MLGAEMNKKKINQESSLESSLCTAILQRLNVNKLVALTGIEPVLRQFSTVQFGLSV